MFQGAVKATMISCHLDNALEYEALSYRWGSDKLTDEILIENDGNPLRLRVTRSAFDLLLARRSIWRKRTVWIDAICINQDDNIEKASQVQLMREIYQKASRVIVFTSSDWYARVAAPLLQELHFDSQLTNNPTRRQNKIVIGQRYSRKWRTVIELLTNEYFNRIWVAQEIIIGQDVQLYYGGLYIPWSFYYEVVSHLAEQPNRDLMVTGVEDNSQTWFDSSTFENISAFSALQKDSPYDIRSNGELRLETVILATSKFKATDPRDQIFAILGISNYADSKLLKVDYGKSAEKVLEDATIYLLLEQGQPAIDVLSLAGIGFSANRLLVPSWVIDRSEERSCVHYTDARRNDNSFRASGDYAASVTAGEISGTLSIRGLLLKEKIQYLSSAGVLNFGDNLSGMQVTSAKIVLWKHGFMQAAKNLVEEHSRLQACEQDIPKNQLWLGFVADRVGRQFIADPKYHLVYMTCFRMLETMVQSQDGISVHVTGDPSEAHRNELELTEQVNYLPQRYLASFMEACFGRCFAMTETGRLCLVPPLTQIGDGLFIPFGAQTPYIVRRKDSLHFSDWYDLIGEAYAQGAMMGEAIYFGDELAIILV